MRCRKKLILLLIVVVVMLIGLLGGSKILHIIRQSDFKVNNLRVDYQKNPIGIDVSDVKFSWQLKSKKNENQKSYRIIVRKATENGKIVWDSGKVLDSNATAIYYEGEKLELESRYFWKVIIENTKGGIAVSKLAYFETATDMSDVKWIVAGNGEKTPLLRAEMELSKDIQSARLYISAMGVYKAYINGKEVCNDVNDMFNPGWTNYYTNINFQTYDITDDLMKGENTIGVVIGGGWYQSGYGTDYKDAFGDANETKERGLLAKIVVEYIDGERKIITTNEEDWKYSLYGPYLYEDFYNGEIYDANIATDIQGWNLPGYDVSKNEQFWKKVETTAYAGNVKPSSKAVAFINDQYEQYPISGYVYNESENIVGTGSAEGLCYGSVVEHKIDVNNKIELKSGDKLILDMGQNMVGITEIEMSGKKQTEVVLRFAEALNDGRDIDYVSDSDNGPLGSDGPRGTLYRTALRAAKCTDKYIMSGNKREIYQQSFTYHGFRYVEISASNDIVVFNVKGKIITSVGEKRGEISTSNSEVNQLVKNIFWSEIGNYLSIPTDCPQRDERGGWTGDAQIFAQTGMLNFEVIRFMENYVDIMDDYAKQNNNIYGPTMPQSGYAGWKCCGWSDAGIIIPWVIYLETGDTKILEKYFDEMNLYMRSINADVDTTDQESTYNAEMFGDWLAYSGTSIKCINALYHIYVTQLMEKISRALGEWNEAQQYADDYQQLKKHFMEKYMDVNGNLLSASADYGNKAAVSFQGYPIIDNAQTGLLWALKTGMYNSEEQKQILVDNLVKNIHNENEMVREGMPEDSLSVGFLGVNVILPILTEVDEGDLAYTLLLQNKNPSWLYEVENGATTMWERWNSYSVKDGFGDSSMNSFNHYAYGSCGEWMYNYMVGIKSDEENPGYKHFILQPIIDREGRIDSVKGSYKSLYGEIGSEWTSNNGKIKTYKAVVPPNTSATLYLPISEEEEKNLILPDGAEYIGRERKNGNECIVYELTSGEYEFYF